MHDTARDASARRRTARRRRACPSAPVSRSTLALLVCTFIGTVVAAGGCATWRGARLYHSGTAALERGDVPRALADLEAAAALVPERSEVYNNLGLAQLGADREDLALRAFERATQLDCRNEAARDNLRRLEARWVASPGEAGDRVRDRVRDGEPRAAATDPVRTEAGADAR